MIRRKNRMRRILRSYIHFLGISCFLLWSINGYSRFQQGIDSTPHLTELILIPHIGNDHQFNLNYTVAHLLALLDAVHPDALVLYDEPEWVKQGCLWQTGNPAAHAVLNYSLEQSVPLYGVGLTAEAFTKTKKSIEDYQKSYPDIE